MLCWRVYFLLSDQNFSTHQVSEVDSALTEQPPSEGVSWKVRSSTYLRMDLGQHGQGCVMLSPGDRGGMCAGDEAALLRAGELVEALLAARQVVAVCCSHGAHLRLYREHHRGRIY